MLVQQKFEPTLQELVLIDFISSADFPWFFQNATSSSYPFFGHTLMSRQKDNLPQEGKVNSEYFQPCISIFKRYCNFNNIKVSKILRACINHTSYDPRPQSELHTDHPFPHKVFLFYLNSFDNGQLIVHNQGIGNKPTILCPSKFDVILFTDALHAITFCSPTQRRLVLVVTFI